MHSSTSPKQSKRDHRVFVTETNGRTYYRPQRYTLKGAIKEAQSMAKLNRVDTAIAVPVED